MNQQRKNRIIAILEQILPVVLAVVCVLVMTLNTHQSNMAIPLPLNFEGEYSFDGRKDVTVTDPGELARLGLSILSWEYPESIENSFFFGGFSLSSEAVIYTAAIAIAALLACMILIKKDGAIVYSKLDKVSVVLNFLIAIVAFPFIFMVSALSEIVADTSLRQQVLYLTPALTVLGIAASVVLRRCGYGKGGLFAQFLGPVLFAVLLLILPL